MKDTQGVSGEFTTEITLEEIAAEDALRLRADSKHDQNTLQRHGRKGARQWGYMTPGSGKRAGKRS